MTEEEKQPGRSKGPETGSEKEKPSTSSGASGGKKEREKPKSRRERKTQEKAEKGIKSTVGKFIEKAAENAIKKGEEVGGKPIKVEQIARLKKLLNKEKEIDKEEKKSLIELLLILLKYLYEQIRDAVLGDPDQHEDFIRNLEALGLGKDPKEIMRFVMQMYEMDEEESEEFEKKLSRLVTGDEEEASEEQEDESEEEVIEEILEEEMVSKGQDPSRADDMDAKRKAEIFDEIISKKDEEVIRLEQEALKARRAGNEAEAERLEDESARLVRQNRDLENRRNRYIRDELLDSAKKSGARTEREIADYLGNMYGPTIRDIYNRMLDVEDAGIFKLLAGEVSKRELTLTVNKMGEMLSDIKKREKEGEEAAHYQRFLAQREKLEEINRTMGESLSESEVKKVKDFVRMQIVKPLFEEIIGDAEGDPRVGFEMKREGYTLKDTLMDKIRDAGPEGADEKRRLDNLFWTRRVFAFLNSELIRGGDPETMHKNSGMLLSEDLDTISIMEPSLTPALGVVERILARVRMDPKNKGMIPYEMLIPSPHAGYKPPEIEQMVRNQLVSMHDKNLLNLGVNREEVEKEAQRVAALAIKTSNVLLRSAEHVAQTQLATRKMGMHLISYPFDKVPLRQLLLGPERFEDWGRGKEGSKPWLDRLKQQIQAGVWEKIPGNKFDELWGINMENYLKYGGPFSGSSWRSLVATEKQREGGVALGVQLYHVGELAKNLKKKGDPRNVKDIEEAIKKDIWMKVGKRMPTVAARYFPTLSLRESGSEKEYFDLEGRLRESVVKSNERQAFLKEVDRKVQEQFEFEGGRGQIEKEVGADVVSKTVRKGNEDAETGRREAKRIKELRLQQGADLSFRWMLAREYGITPGTEGWEEKVFKRWEELHSKLTILEEHALQLYLKDKEGYQKDCKDDEDRKRKRDEKYKGVLELIQGDKTGELLKKLDIKIDPKEKRIIERLTYLGGEKAGEAGVGAERLAKVDFTFLPFMEDVIHKDTEWANIGPRGASRRIGGDAELANKTNQVMTRIDQGLHVYEDRTVKHRAELAQSLSELYATAGHLGEEEKRKLVAAKADTIIEHMYKSAWWANWLPFGFVLDWGGPAKIWKGLTLSSNAQRKFGGDALSMNPLELRKFVEHLRPIIGNDLAGELLKKHHARAGHVLLHLFAQYSIPGAVVGGWQLFLKPFLQELGKYLQS